MSMNKLCFLAMGLLLAVIGCASAPAQTKKPSYIGDPAGRAAYTIKQMEHIPILIPQHFPRSTG